MTIKDLQRVATEIYEDEDAYQDLWEAVATLCNYGLLDGKYRKALVALDPKLFNEQEQGA